MARECQVCGTGPQVGNRVDTRVKVYYLCGVGTKVTGITRRQFKPNLQSVRVQAADGSVKRMKVCTQCIRSGKITKPVRQKPFDLSKADEAAS